MENQDGKRVARGPGMPRGGKIALAVVLVLVLALAGGYVGLCAYAGSSAFLPNTSIAGVDVSGQSREGAAAALEGALPGLLADSRAEFTCAGQSYAVNGDDPSVSVDAAAAVDAALTDQAGSFFTRGGRYLAAVMHGNRYSVPVTLTGTPDAVTRAVEECSDPEAQTTWEVTDTELVLHKGVTGRTIDVAALTDALAERLGHLVSNDEPASYAPIEAQVTTAPPAAPDFDAIRSEVAAEPADAYLDKETREIVPSVTGVDFDTAQAQAVLDAAGEGETVSVPLLLTEPELTTAKLEANLFKDVLGSGSTTCAGPSNRWYNIDLAAKRLNGTILLPGETFSYNDTVGPYTLASGYKAAGTYQNGQSVDATAGGICQLSSNLYWVTLKANLEIVERHKHQFNGGYMPVIGTDATVWSDQLDFRFQNNTDYPIKIESYLDKNHKLHVTIYGTDTTGIHGEPYHVVISTVPYKNTYQPKDSIPVGTEPQRDPNYSRYNGYTVDLYQKLVDKNGKTISTTLLYRNTYKASDAVYYYNPADAARWGIDPSTGLKTLTPVTPTPSPSPSPSPAPSPTPGGTPSPVPTATPVLPLEPSPTVPPSPESPPAYTPPVEATATPESGVGPGMEPVEETPLPAPTPADTPPRRPPPDPKTRAEAQRASALIERKKVLYVSRLFRRHRGLHVGHPVQQRKGLVRGPQGGVPDHLSAAHEGAGRRGVRGLYRPPSRPGPHLQGVPHLPGRPAALRPRPLQGPSVAEPDPPPRGGLRRAGVLVRAGPGGLLLRHGLLAGSSRHHGQVPRPHGPGAQGHGKAGPPLPEAGRVCAGGGGLQAPQGRPLPAAHPLVQQKELRPLPRRPPRGAALVPRSGGSPAGGVRVPAPLL